MNQALGLIAGLCGGIIWEKISTSPFGRIATITPSWTIQISNHVVHIHHWILYLALLIIFGAIAAKTNRLLHPSALMIFSFLIAAMLYNFYKFPDWHVFVR